MNAPSMAFNYLVNDNKNLRNIEELHPKNDIEKDIMFIIDRT